VVVVIVRLLATGVAVVTRGIGYEAFAVAVVEVVAIVAPRT